jgi:hypothetical protein
MNQESAEFFVWLDYAWSDWDIVSPDDWYEAMAALMAERGPA